MAEKPLSLLLVVGIACFSRRAPRRALAPTEKYLVHSFVESDEMKNVYDGTVDVDPTGHATVTLPSWFEALNTNFRYQLTAIGGPANPYIEQEIRAGVFVIAGGKGATKVSWQVTGTRKDAFARQNAMAVEVDKAPKDKGRYLHPSAFGQPDRLRITPSDLPPSVPNIQPVP